MKSSIEHTPTILELARHSLVDIQVHIHNLESREAKLIDAIAKSNKYALELMERAAKTDRMLFLATNNQREPDYELGQVIRMREQIGRNNVLINNEPPVQVIS